MTMWGTLFPSTSQRETDESANMRANVPSSRRDLLLLDRLDGVVDFPLVHEHNLAASGSGQE